MVNLVDEYLQKHRDQSQRAFAEHVIVTESEGRWLLQRLRDGRPDWTYAAEVIVLEGGALYVGGDITHVIFAYGPRETLARVRWMGECTDLSYYVAQKARIGKGESVDRWVSEIAEAQLRAHVAENPLDLVDPDALEDALSADDQETFYDEACRALGGGDAYETVSSMGEVLDSAVIYAHAALARLCQLLREREKGAG